MGSLLGLLLADTFMTKLGNDPLELSIHILYLYERYLDDIFCLLNALTEIYRSTQMWYSQQRCNWNSSPRSIIK